MTQILFKGFPAAEFASFIFWFSRFVSVIYPRLLPFAEHKEDPEHVHTSHRQLTSLTRTSTQHLVERHQIGKTGEANGDQTLLRAIERALRVQNAQVAVNPAFVSQI